MSLCNYKVNSPQPKEKMELDNVAADKEVKELEVSTIY